MLYVQLAVFLFLILCIAWVLSRRQKKENGRIRIHEAMLEYDKLMAYAVKIARNHEITYGKNGFHFLMDRLNDNYHFIAKTYEKLSESQDEKVVPAAEWLLDNFYVIEQQTKEMRRNVKEKLYSHLPLIKEGSFQGYPRIYAVAVELMTHTDCRIESGILTDFLNSYQEVQMLRDDEIWAVPFMIQVALLETIRLQCKKINESQNSFRAAEAFLTSVENGLRDVGADLSKYINVHTPLNTSFLEFIYRSLMKKGENDIIQQMDQKLENLGMTAEKVLKVEYQKQSSRQLTIGNAITSMRFIVTLDFTEIFQNISVVEKILRDDPAGVYDDMTQASKNYYKQRIQQIAKRLKISEIEVARRALQLSQSAVEGKRRHIGYYICNRCLELDDRKHRKTHQLLYYIAVILLGLIAPVLLAAYASYSGAGWGGMLAAFLLPLVPSLDLSMNLVHYLITRFIPVSMIPKLAFEDGIGDDCATMVVISTLLPDAERTRELVRQLEMHYLANREDNLCFGLLGDYKDISMEINGDEEEIRRALSDGIGKLNQKYGQRFYGFIRKRQYSAYQNKWLGWERKRGAITELNYLLRGTKLTSFEKVIGRSLPAVRYVITLDADTVMPIGTAKELVGAMAHPLNRPELSEDKTIVTDGFGLLQPRIGVSLESANKSFFSRIFAGQGGIDPYSGAVSDVYQDLFGEGIFTGKGIYDVDAFLAVLGDTIPENRVLSHDLLEGSYLHAGLVSDIEFVDSYPYQFRSYTERMHRWIRGDWQLLPWLLSHVKNARGERVKNPLPFLARWKMLDNLKRSLLYPCLALIMFLAFCHLPGQAYVWLLFSLLCLSSTLLIAVVNSLADRSYRYYGQRFHTTIYYGLKAVLLQVGLLFLFLPYQGYKALDAVIRSLYRVLFSKKHLLDWVTAADVEKKLKDSLGGMYLKMLPAVVYSVLLIICARQYRLLALLTGLLWILSPLAAYLVSRPIKRQKEMIEQQDVQYIRLLARKIWRFFEDFCGKYDHYLPPDNYQEYPPNGAAHRTSPTNIGLLLTSALAARDFGFLTSSDLLERLENTVSTLEQMEKWHGHFYNWYHTTNLNVLPPRYVSTVDSGNLLGYLITVSEGLRMLTYGPDPCYISGLEDTIRLEDEKFLPKFTAYDWNHSAQWHDNLNQLKENLPSQMRLTAQRIEAIQNELQQDQVLLCQKAADLKERIDRLSNEMDFSMLYDKKQELFSIGYNIEEERLTRSYYDLLASEARQTSFMAVARGEVDKKHWSRLNRSLTMLDHYRGLVSWTGTMFEYLMPLLTMPVYENTLLDETYQFVIYCQKRYGRKRNVPWGTSESGFYAFDMQLNYQYKAFGVPELGLKRGLSSEMVVAPYATAMALMVAPNDSIHNMRRLSEQGCEGVYGFYEAVDYTPQRLMPGQEKGLVKSFMAHHQGMSMLAIDNLLNDNVMQRRFIENPLMQSAKLLLQEKIPVHVVLTKETKEKIEPLKKPNMAVEECIREYAVPDRFCPQVHLLSNGVYSTMLTDDGSGWSRYDDVLVNRWRYQAANRSFGHFIYLRDVGSGRWWTNTYAPSYQKCDQYRAVFSPSKAEYFRRDGSVETITEVYIGTEDNSEIRNVCLINHGEEEAVIEATSYLEPLLARYEAEVAHPAFLNLFVRTEFLDSSNALLAIRRPRGASEQELFMVESVACSQEPAEPVSFETDRAKFIGRNRSVRDPAELELPLSKSVGNVLDPAFCLRVKFKIPGGERVKVSFTTSLCKSREQAEKLAVKYSRVDSCKRAAELAYARSVVESKYLEIGKAEQQLIFALTSRLLFPLRQADYKEFRNNNHKGQPALWTYGISGDNSILLCFLQEVEHIDIIGHLLQAHEFWRMHGLSCDLAIVHRDDNLYEKSLANQLKEIIGTSHARSLVGQNGGIFLIDAATLPDEDLSLLVSVASLVLDSRKGGIAQQLQQTVSVADIPLLQPAEPVEYGDESVPMPELRFFNGMGGFTDDEYVILLKGEETTPAPWVNVCANPAFGCLISESGSVFTWSDNSGENKLTPWNNDAVGDTGGEFLLLRDNETAHVWSVTPSPMRESQDYLVRHGFGYSSFIHNSNGLKQSLTIFAAREESVKCSLLRIKNVSGHQRKISLLHYLKPVMGSSEEFYSKHVIAGYRDSVLLFRNPYNTAFPGQRLFVGISYDTFTYTCDCFEFFGNCQQRLVEAALRRERFSNTCGSFADICSGIMAEITMKALQESSVVIVMGTADSEEEAIRLCKRYTVLAEAEEELVRVKRYWREILSTIQVSTPEPSFDAVVNGWLLYQTLSCRVWGRTAFYQCGGAYGFRDQLQDCMALTYAAPELARRQILLHAVHQFEEGDVQHWWHPDHSGNETQKGIRTRFSDDYLWLPYVVCEYIEKTGDRDILNEMVPFLQDAPLEEGEDERYSLPRGIGEPATLHTHCMRAIERAMRFGSHGIPLMGSGDWNDGMNLVGNGGQGESVWLGWFLIETMERFSQFCKPADQKRFQECRSTLTAALEDNAWDGNWYRRAYFDDGTPLGSSENEECKIDLIAQSWAALCGAADPQRVREALGSVDKYLVDREEGIIKLLTPAFDVGPLNPGYIKGYLPGVRENGGQYTHGAVWLVRAYARIGEFDKAYELFSMINPVNHSATLLEAMRYKTEPYVVAADVYANFPNQSRGGWTWYTGAAGWLYRTAIETILGFHKSGDMLILTANAPRMWKEYRICYRYIDTNYEIIVRNPNLVRGEIHFVLLDGKRQENKIELQNDHKNHRIEAEIEQIKTE